jgi:DNA polymerase-3 subunit epsilon
VVVAHKRVLIEMYCKSMALYGLDYADLNIASRWECTVKIYKAKG